MKNKTTLVALFTVSVLLLGAVAGPLNFVLSADALKGQGVPTSKYGAATKGTVCGGNLCSEVTEDVEVTPQDGDVSPKTPDCTARGPNVDLHGCDLSEANLSEAILTGAHLFSADLSGAILTGADLGEAVLLYAHLFSADLTNANLWGANLGGADFSEAILTGANLTDAGLTVSDANFEDCIGTPKGTPSTGTLPSCS